MIDWLIGRLTDWFLRKAVTIVTESKQINIFCILHVRGRAPQVVKWSVLWEKVSLGGGAVYLIKHMVLCITMPEIALHPYHDLSYMKVKGDQHPVLEVTPNKHWLQTQ